MITSAVSEGSEVREGKFPQPNETALPVPALNVSGFFCRKNDSYGYDWADPR